MIAFLLVWTTLFGGAVVPDTTSAPAVWVEFDRMGAQPLWPGFEPRGIPLAIYDGEKTWLFRHPSPPPGFAAAPGSPGVFLLAGRHRSVTANSSADLGGVSTATLILDPKSSRSASDWAAIAVHEAFHVFQRKHHPDWSGNEMELFLYPMEDTGLLQMRRLETEALRRALASASADEQAAWARAALQLRRERFARLPASSAAYERGSELNEGLANYVQHRALGDSESGGIAEATFAPEEVRSRTYVVGRALALLLDRFAPEWAARLEAGPTTSLDELLQAALSRDPGEPAVFSDSESEQALDRARADVETLQAKRETLRREFFAQPGWTIVIAAGNEPLWPQGFDPLNVQRLAAGEVLHTRFLKLGNAAGTLELLGRRSLTEGAGAHPLFNGVRRVTIAGLAAEPALTVSEQEGTVSFDAEGVKLEFRGARLERSGRILTLTLAPATAGS